MKCESFRGNLFRFLGIDIIGKGHEVNVKVSYRILLTVCVSVLTSTCKAKQKDI